MRVEDRERASKGTRGRGEIAVEKDRETEENVDIHMKISSIMIEINIALLVFENQKKKFDTNYSFNSSDYSWI